MDVEIVWRPSPNSVTVLWQNAGDSAEASEAAPAPDSEVTLLLRKEGSEQQKRVARFELGVQGITFGCLLPSTSYTLCIQCNDLETEVDVQTGLAVSVPGVSNLDSRTFLQYDPSHQGDLEWVHKVQGDYLWTSIDAAADPAFLDMLCRVPLFLLPTSYGVCHIPNPVKRFSIDLTKPGVNWQRSRRMKPSKLAGFRMTINRDFRKSLEEVAKLHGMLGAVKDAQDSAQEEEEEEDGEDLNAIADLFTWIKPELVETLKTCQRKGETGESPIQHHSFELWEGETLVAVSLGYSVGANYHDYTHGALVRDTRRLGTMLTKAVGHLLSQAGYTFWYWGCRCRATSYMGDYMQHYGGHDYSREEFLERWKPNVDAADAPPVGKLEELLVAGKALIQPKLPSGSGPAQRSPRNQSFEGDRGAKKRKESPESGGAS